MFKQFKELWDIMNADPAVNHRLPILKRLTFRSLGWMVGEELLWVVRMLPLMFLVNWLNTDHHDYMVLLQLAIGTLVLHLISDQMTKYLGICRNQLNWYQWALWWSYGHRQELRQSEDWHIKHGTGEKDSLVAKNIYKFETLIDQLIFNTAPVALRVTFICVGLYFIGWQWGLIASLVLIGYLIVVYRTEKSQEAQRREHREEMRQVEVFGSELTNNWSTIKDLGSEESMSDKNDNLLFQFCKNEEGRTRFRMKKFVAQASVLSWSRFAVYLTVGLSLLMYQPTIGAIVLAITWLEQIYSNLWRLVDLQMLLSQGLVALEELVGIMKLPPTVQQDANPIDPSELEPNVVIGDLGFEYPEADGKSALHSVDLEIPAYSSIAIVGMSGSGKSTLVKMLQRKYDPLEGAITVDGVDLRRLDLATLRQEYIGVVSQHTRLFSGTIADNIRMGNPDASQHEIYLAAKKAHALDFILDQPEKFNAQVGENGITLSGGQAQRIALARMFVRQPKIAILDEPTSAQDAITQDYVKESFNDMITSRKSTTIIIAHRFSTIMNVDLVVVMDQGRVVEIGTHEELQSRGGVYCRLRELESQGLLNHSNG